MPALAITDLANVFGLIKFYRAARGAGVKPIAGCDVWLTHDAERDAPFRALLLCASRDGYLRLCDWLSRGYRGNQHRGRAEVRREWFDEGTQGLIALSGARDGDVGSALLQGNVAGAGKAARDWAARFPGRYYLEVQRAGRPDDDALVAATAELAADLALPLVATHPVQFLRRDDFRAHEARVSIAEGHLLADPRRPRHFTAEQHFATQAEMAARFADLPEALANSVAIAQRCNLAIPLGKPHLPRFPTPEGVTLDEHLRDESRRGLEVRLAALFPDAAERERRRPEYEARLAFEANTIAQMGFAGYFLIVADFINWAKRNDVPVGPGRGSGAGSLVAYALGITDLDPLRYALLFERFLNPERVSMPDFDIDFCQDKRELVIDYVKRRYGADSVSQIATFGTMAAKAAVRDVGRVLDLPYGFVDSIAKLIPFQPGKQVTLRQAREMEPLLAERERNEEEVRQLLELAEALEGLTRNVGMHAGGVLDRARQDHRLLPAVRAARRGRHGVAVRQGRRGGRRAGQVRLPRPHHAHDPRLDAALHRQARPGSEGGAGNVAAGRPRGLRRLQDRQHQRGVPVRIARHARSAHPRQARPLRGHHRPGRAVPPGPDGPDPRLHRPQARPPEGRVPRPAARPDPGPHLRGDDLPGAGDADRAGHRRLLAGRRGPAAARDGQEEARGDGAAPRDLRGRRGEERRREAEGHRALQPDGEVRGLRLQQVARRRLRARRLPDRVLQGSPHRRVHGREPLAGHGRHRQGARAVRRHGRAGAGDPAAGRERVGLPLRARRRQRDPLRAGRRSRAPASRRSSASSPRARAAERSAISSTSAAASTSASATGA